MKDIRQSIEKEKELKRQRKFLQNIMATIPDSLLILDRHLRIKSANRSFCKLFQTGLEKIKGSGVADVLGDEDGKLSVRLAGLFGTEDTLKSFELCYQSEKLGERILNIAARGIIFAEEEEEEVLVVIQDITEHRQAEEALKSSEERLRVLFEYAPDAYYLSDLNGDFVGANKVAEEITGYKKDELIGKSFAKLNLLPPGQLRKAEKLLARSMLGQATGPDEFTLNRKDGNQVPVEIRTFPVKVKGKTLVLSIAHDLTQRKRAEEALRKAHDELERRVEERTAELTRVNWELQMDITERKRAEEALRESEARYRALVEAGERMGEAIILVQDTDKMEAAHLFANQEWTGITGYTAEELREISYYDLIHPRYRAAVVDRVRRRLQQGEDIPGRWEISIIAKDGTEVPIEVAGGSPITYLGKPANVAYLRDITERKRAEAALRESETRYRTLVETASRTGEAIVLI